MTGEIEQLFHTLTDLSPDARAQYLAEHEIDGETRREVEALLAFDSGASAFLAREVSIAAVRALPQLEGKGWRCGPYRLLDVVGHGGMGTVYLAERADGEVTQTAAVKLLASGAGEIQRERFLQERQILASLSHPNIARMLDAGHLDNGQPFLAMEYVDGNPIDVFAASMSLRDKIALFLKVCGAVDYLHRNSVVHRDLKPSNILVTGVGSRQPGEPKLLDFGIAKLLDIATDSTLTSLRMLTPDYASPEQVTGAQVGTATDIYSLGAVLYKLLTGKPAHQFANPSAEGITRTVTTREVTRPSKWAPELNGDLESILLKALRKDPQERYANVNEFAEDLEAYLASRAVRARSGTAWYRARKFLRRNRTVLTVGLASAVSIAAVIGMMIQARTARAPSESSMPEPLTSFAGLEKTAAWSPDGRQVVFARTGEKQNEFDIYVMQPGSSHALRLTDAGSNRDPAWSPDGARIAFVHSDSHSERYSLELISPLGGPIRTVLTTETAMGRISWMPDGRTVVLEILSGPGQPGALWVVWVETGRRRRLTSPPAGIPGDTAPAVSPDGRTVAFCRTTFWRTAELYLLDLKRDLSPAGVERRITDLGFVAWPTWTPDGARIIFDCSRTGAGMCQIDRAGRLPRSILGVPPTASQAATARRPGGFTSLIFTMTTSESSIWRYSTEAGAGEEPVELARSSRSQDCPRYSSDSLRIAFDCDRAGYQEIWTAKADGSQPVQLTDLHHLLTETPDWSPSDDRIAFVSQDRANRQIYVIGSAGGPAAAITNEEGIRSGDGWSSDARWYYYTSTRSGREEVWKTPVTGGQPQQMTTNGGLCGFESTRGVFYYWKRQNNRRANLMRRTPAGDQVVPLTPDAVSCRTSPSPKGFYFKSANSSDIYLYEEAAGRCTRVLRRPERAFGRFTVSPDGQWAAVDSDNGQKSDLMIMEHFR